MRQTEWAAERPAKAEAIQGPPGILVEPADLPLERLLGERGRGAAAASARGCDGRECET